jgi:hypothetical protein
MLTREDNEIHIIFSHHMSPTHPHITIPAPVGERWGGAGLWCGWGGILYYRPAFYLMKLFEQNIVLSPFLHGSSASNPQ